MATPPTPRTTPALVMGIIQTETGVDLTPFIAIANQVTTDNCTYPKLGQDATKFPAYTDGFVGSKMELIERWLAAHFYTIFDNQLSRAGAGTVSVGFQYEIGMALKNSMYGQQAMMLDNYGGLAGLTNTLESQRNISVIIKSLGRRRGYPGYVVDPNLTMEQ